MGPLPFILAAAGAGAAAGGAAGFALGAGGVVLGFTALLSGTAAGSFAAALAAARARSAVEARFGTLAEEMVLIRQRQAEWEQKLSDVERSAKESSALVWRAATSDIQVLGSLVSDLARSVAAHEERLDKMAHPAAPPSAASVAPSARSVLLPRTSPPPRSWFEEDEEQTKPSDEGREPPRLQDEAEDRAGEKIPDAAAARASLVGELKSTLAAALAGDRLEICLQPFVALPQRRVAGYEATLALKAGDDAPRDAERLAAAARACGMTAELDRLLIERAGQVLRVLRARERVVAMTCAVSARSLIDAGFRSAVEAVARAEGKLAQNIVLSIPADEAAALLGEGGREALESLGRSGVGLGVSAATAAGLDLAMLERIKARELRLAAAALLGDGRPDIHPADVSEMLERRGVRLLITGIDSEATMRDLLDCAATLGQGALFGASRPVRPEVLHPRPVAEQRAAQRVEAARSAVKPQQPARQSFRSLLRRA
jgi:cyclic-di-GMP phosphodiesterase TipF (flagellum assembly factor)